MHSGASAGPKGTKMTDDYESAYHAFETADRDWQAELARVYGRERRESALPPARQGRAGYDAAQAAPGARGCARSVVARG